MAHVHRPLAIFAAVFLSIGALIGAAFPAMASPAFLAIVIEPAASLELDRLGHQLQISGESPNLSASVAFVQRALTHDRYRAGGFVLGSETAS